MNPAFAHRVHVGAIVALILVLIVAIGRRYTSSLPPGYESIVWFGMIYGGVIIALLVTRLRQVVSQGVAVDPVSGLERITVFIGQALLFLGVPGYIVAALYFAPDGPIWARLINNMSLAALWVSLALIELVIANGRSAELPPEHRSSAFAKIFIGLVLLGAGFALGVAAVFGFFLLGLRH